MKNTEEHLRLTVFSAGNKRYTLAKQRRAITPHIQKSFYLFVVVCITFLSGCKNPYALRIDSVDYSSIGTGYVDAAIQMSPPTIYARETLINDRRREHEYLKGVLEGSKAKIFESELRRELTNISALSASLGLSFDQGAKEEFLKQRALSESETNLTLERLSAASQQLGLQQTFENDRLASITEQNQLIDQRNALLQQGQIEQAELQQQLALENLRLELMRQQYEVERLQSIIDDNRERASLADQANQGEQPGQERQSTALDALPDSNEIDPVTPGTPLASGLSLQNNPPAFANRDLSAISLSSADSQSTISSLNAKLTHALNLLQTEVKKAQGVDVSLSPEQEFAARQAYRRTIRSAIAENNLDDLHDKGGNSLFRLQFTATVLPGKDANRWGMATYRLSSPNATKDNLENLYNEWLTHVTLRLNEAADSRDNGERPLGLSDIRYELLQSTGLYDIARFYQNEKGQINPINNCFVADSLEVANSYNCISIPLAVPPKSAAEFTSAKLYWDHILLNVLYAKLVDAIASGEYNAITEYHKSSKAANRTLNNFYKVTSLEVAIKELHELAQYSDIANNDAFNEMILKLIVNAKNYREKNNYLDEAGVSEARAQVIQNDYNKKYNVPTETEKSTSAGDSKSGSTKQEKDTLPSTPPSEVQLIEVLKTLTLKQLGEILPANEVLKRVRVYRQLGPSVVKSAEGVISRINLKKEQREVIMQIMERLARNVAISHQAIPVLAQLDIGEDELTLACLFPELVVETDVLPRITLEQLQPGTGISICPPSVFAGAVLASGTEFNPTNLSDCGLKKDAKFAGDARPYSTTPRIRSQRISTVTSAVDAFELGLSLAAKAPSAGLRGDAGIGLARTAAGKVQAREQVPLVVGFAAARGDHPIRDQSTHSDNSIKDHTNSGVDSSKVNTDSSQHSTKNHDAKFGWVFGPRTIVDAEDQSLKLAQQVTTHDVTADISMPGWWPYAKANLKTSWVGDEWRTGGLEASNAKTQTLNIKLAQTQADMDGLADFVSQKIIGKSLQAAHISSVFPKSISLCRDTAHLVLHGSNLWRSTQVFLDGIKAKPGSIEVLPDMEGIEAQFDATLLRKRSRNAGKVSLKVWTRDGFADYPVEITGESKGGSCLDGPRPKPAKFQLVSIVPDTVSSCLSESKKTEFILTLRGLNLRSTKSTTTGTGTETETEKKAGEDFYVYLGGKDVKADRMHNFGKNEKHIDILKIGVDAKDIKLKYWQGLGSIPLLVLGEKHIINHDIPILSVPTEMCGKAPPTSGKFDAAATSIHSVSGDGVIDVCVSKLMLGLKNAKGGLERVRQIEWLGQKVTPAPGPGGKSAHAVFDKLPRLEKRGADQLPLRLIGASKKILGTLQVKTACDRTTGQSAASVNKSMRGS